MNKTKMTNKNIRRVWTVLMGIVLIALLVSGCGGAQQSKVYHVGVLSGLSAFSSAVDGFKTQMTTLGYIEGKNITYDVQSSNVDTAAYKTAIKKFVDEKVDLIFTFPTEATIEAKADTQGTNIPVVFTLSQVNDVGGGNLINSIQEPGGNITGVRIADHEIASKRLEILLELVPNAKRVFLPYLKDYPNVPAQLEILRPQAQSAGVQLVEFPAASPQDLQTELDRRTALGDVGFDAILTIPEPSSIIPAFYDILGKFAYEHRIPIGGALMTIDGNNGSIFGLLPDAKTSGQQAALPADKIFKGTPAGTIPVGTLVNYFQINYKAAQVFGLTVPADLLKQADQVIK